MIFFKEKKEKSFLIIKFDMCKLIGVLVYFWMIVRISIYNIRSMMIGFYHQARYQLVFCVGLNLNSLIQWQETLAIESNEAHNCLIIKYNYHRMDNT